VQWYCRHYGQKYPSHNVKVLFAPGIKIVFESYWKGTHFVFQISTLSRRLASYHVFRHYFKMSYSLIFTIFILLFICFLSSSTNKYLIRHSVSWDRSKEMNFCLPHLSFFNVQNSDSHKWKDLMLYKLQTLIGIFSELCCHGRERRNN